MQLKQRWHQAVYQWKTNRNLRLGVIAGLLISGAAFVWLGIYLVIRNQPTLQLTPEVMATSYLELLQAEPVLNQAVAARKTDGVIVPLTETNHYPIAVMIENAAFGGVRPQFGLNSAQIVYELVVEGGITRLMAIYAGAMPAKIGPVRSARPTYVDFIAEYDALYAHAGGSPEALQAIVANDVKDLSALSADSRFFTRDSSRVAPHNLFTSAELLTLARRDKGLVDTSAQFDSWQFKADSQPVTEPTDTKFIDVKFGSPLYDVHYVYNYVGNNYERWNGGEQQSDANDQSILTAKNVIVQMVPPAVSAGDSRVNFTVTGEGKVYIARDGEVIEGVWKKAERTSRTQYYTTTGESIALNRGTTWVEILPEPGTVEHN